MQQQVGQNENLTLKLYEKNVKEDVASIQNNLYEMLKLLRIEDDRTIKVLSII
jgi:hypothetical protein